MYFDASKVGLGSVLMQEAKVISNASGQLKIQENNYPTNDLELASVVIVLKHWGHYSYGVHVYVFTDHKSLKYVVTQSELNLRHKRFLELLKDYDISVHHYQGKANVVDSDLSRLSTMRVFHIYIEKKELVKEVH